ncbi:hypothetical protein [Nocardia sp. NPDC051981]|uniref:hypothetical protein n=1 Tax=Nocardia sp. NPDC051981 TaxID=3155417 RepID=UPI0034150E06
MDFPWDYFETAISAGDERFSAAQLIEFGPGHMPEDDDSEFAVEARAGKQHLAGQLMLAHPGQVIVEAAVGRRASIAEPPVQRQVPRFSLLGTQV